tara:strand:- start:80 stop:271 length:192 start_codon:yes stop_codon:yes gene_type:complete
MYGASQKGLLHVPQDMPLLSVRYRSLSLPLISNPAIPLSGVVGAAKTAAFDAAGETLRQWILL